MCRGGRRTRSKNSGYVDPEDLTPWGGADDYIRLVSPLRSQMKTSLCDNQHNAAVGILEEYPKRTGLPREEYFDHLQEPDPNWLKIIEFLLIAGENDKGHWVKGDASARQAGDVHGRGNTPQPLAAPMSC